jgi:16S rRNA (adenine1518-N6/adenine1519-N6)-dimethyltransferase
MKPRYGQHFLRNAGAIETILRRFAAGPEDRVVEIGPGRGALTRSLAPACGRFAAVEIDAGLADALARGMGAPLWSASELREAAARTSPERSSPTPAGSASGDELSSGTLPRRIVVGADALEVRYEDLAAVLGAGPSRRLRVIGNLPYGVATALIRRMAAERTHVAEALVMVQKEVADRLLAEPSTKPYGLISVLIALRAERRRVMTLEPASFSPPPKVRSSVVALRFHAPRGEELAEDARLLGLLKAAFSERRKMLWRNLAKHYGLDRGRVEALIADSGAAVTARAEDLPPTSYARLASRLPAPPHPAPDVLEA